MIATDILLAIFLSNLPSKFNQSEKITTKYRIDSLHIKPRSLLM